jgi:hypothetical protein
MANTSFDALDGSNETFYLRTWYDSIYDETTINTISDVITTYWDYPVMNKIASISHNMR